MLDTHGVTGSNPVAPTPRRPLTALVSGFFRVVVRDQLSMTILAHSESINPVQENPTGAAAPQPAPPEMARSQGRWAPPSECLLAGLVLSFAFLVSSFVARNADVWLHLATGRLVAQGAYSFGNDPFSYTTNGVYWANTSWLYDLGLYQLFNAAGDAQRHIKILFDRIERQIKRIGK